MRTLKGKRGKDTVLPIEAELAPRGRGVSRLHRRPVWRAAGILAELPVWTGTAGALTFLGATIAYGIALGGYGTMVSESLTAAAGFRVEAVKLSGQRETTEFQILEALEIQSDSSLVLFDAQAAQKRLNDISWVEKASVQKLYPGTLQVKIKEREPFALWQRGDVISIISKDGRVITDDVDGRYANLLLVIGHGAQHRVGNILNELRIVPELRSRVRAARLISDRRWNLVLENGITIRLPETGVEKALVEIAKMDADSGLLSRDIIAVDMRLDDRVIVKLSEGAAERRKGVVSQRRGGANGAET